MPDVVRTLRRVGAAGHGPAGGRPARPVARAGRAGGASRACSRPARRARAAEGLQAALDDPAFDIRAAAAAALAAIHERSAVVRITRDEVLARVRRELDSGETVDRQIPQIYALLSLALERGPLQIAWAAMKSEDRNLRGTALEYLANVLPEDVFKRLRSCFGAVTWSAGRCRGRWRSSPTSCAPRPSACASSIRPGARAARRASTSARPAARERRAPEDRLNAPSAGVVAEVRREPALDRSRGPCPCGGGSRAPGRGRSCRARSSALRVREVEAADRRRRAASRSSR